MTPQLLREAVAALYGPRGASEFARQRGVSDRTVRYWLAGRHPIPGGLRAEIEPLLRERAKDIRRLLPKLRNSERKHP